MPKQKAAEALFDQLSKTLETDGEELVSKLKGLVLFKIDDEEWTLDLRSGKGKVSKGGAGSDKPDLTLTISDENFVKLVMGKMGPQQVLLDMSRLRVVTIKPQEVQAYATCSGIVAIAAVCAGYMFSLPIA
ncbi:TPA: hypothetical protein ACH3X1_012181 [Trebouxia sp. C0004]